MREAWRAGRTTLLCYPRLRGKRSSACSVTFRRVPGPPPPPPEPGHRLEATCRWSRRHLRNCRSLHRHAGEGSRSISDGAAYAFASAPARRPSGDQQNPGGWALSTNRAGGSRSCRNAASPVKFALAPQTSHCPQALPRAASDGALSLRCTVPDPADSDCSTGTTAVRSSRCSVDGASPLKSSGSARAHSHGSLLSFCAGQRTMSAATSGRPSHDGAPASDVSEQSDREPSAFSAQPALSSGGSPHVAGLFGPAGRVSASRVPSPFVPERHNRVRDAQSLDERRRDELESGLQSRIEEARHASEMSRAASEQLDHDLRRQSEESHHNAAAASAQRRSLDSGRQQDPAAGPAAVIPSAPRPCIPHVASVSAFSSHARFLGAVGGDADANGESSADAHARAAMRRAFSHQLSGSLAFPQSPVESAPSDDDTAFGFPGSPVGGGALHGSSSFRSATQERRLVRLCAAASLRVAWPASVHLVFQRVIRLFRTMKSLPSGLGRLPPVHV